jgi:hypothetical protein
MFPVYKAWEMITVKHVFPLFLPFPPAGTPPDTSCLRKYVDEDDVLTLGEKTLDFPYLCAY